ncbi:PQQ-like beta-propeller repeat protein [Nocardiopsis sp. ARC36]
MWQYRVGDNARAAYASHAGDYLAVETEGSEGGPTLVELDPSTGEVLQEIAIEESSGGDSGIDAGAFSRNVAHGVRIARDPFDDPALRAIELDTGENLWVQQEPPECTTIEATSSDTTVGMVMGDIVLEGYSCAGARTEPVCSAGTWPRVRNCGGSKRASEGPIPN